MLLVQLFVNIQENHKKKDRRLSMKYLILLLLVITSCTDKKVTTEPIVIEPIIVEVPKPEPIKISYDKGLDLILIGSDYRLWYSEFLLDKEGFYSPDDMEQARPHATSYYWDSNDNTYYMSHMQTTNDIIFTIDTNLQYETLYDPYFIEKYVETNSNNIVYAEILYVGSITPLERVYYDPTNNIQYIKELQAIPTDYYRDFKTGERTELPADTILYPSSRRRMSAELTNNIQQKFYIGIGGDLVLDEY